MTDAEAERALHSLVAALGEPERRDAASADLLALGPRAREAVRAGLGDGRWQVRRWCVQWIWRFPEPGDVKVLEPLLRDPKSRVRHSALVALSNAPATDPSDVVSLLLERILVDQSLRVRRQAVLLLAWLHPHPDLERFFAELEECERDAKLRKYACIGRLRSRARVEDPASC